MGRDLAFSLVNQCKEIGVSLIYYHAVGESLLNPHCVEVLQHGDALKLNNSLSTNCYILKGDLADELRKLKSLALIFSVHWVMNDRFISKCIENVLAYLDAGFQNKSVIVQLVCDVNAQEHYQRFLDTFQKAVQKTPRASMFFKQPCTFPNDVEPNIGFIPDAKGPGIKIDRRRTPYSIGRVCRQPDTFLSILADGTVVPCCVGMDNWDLGNANESSLYDIWNSKRMHEIRALWRSKDNSIPCGPCLNRKDC